MYRWSSGQCACSQGKLAAHMHGAIQIPQNNSNHSPNPSPSFPTSLITRRPAYICINFCTVFGTSKYADGNSRRRKYKSQWIAFRKRSCGKSIAASVTSGGSKLIDMDQRLPIIGGHCARAQSYQAQPSVSSKLATFTIAKLTHIHVLLVRHYRCSSTEEPLS